MSIYTPGRGDIDLPRLDLLTLLFDSNWAGAKEDTNLHIEAANPDNFITKAEARDLVKRIAYVLRNQYGIGANGPGKDVVLFITDGSPFLPILFYAVVAAGGVMSGASTAYRLGEIVRQVKDAETALIICGSAYKSVSLETASQCGISSDRVLIQDSTIPRDWKLLSSGRNVIELGNGEMLDWRRSTDERELRDTMICLLYSSGTTGLPKGVRISDWAVMSNTICTMDPAIRYKAQNPEFIFDTIAHLPFANIAGINMYCSNPIYVGGSTYWMERYDFDSFVEYHRKYRPAYQYTVPPVWLRIAKSDKVTDQFDGLRVAVTGSAPIGYATAQEVRVKLGKGKAIMRQTWGATEITGVITAQDWLVEDKDWSVGEICPNLRLRIVDSDDKDVPYDSEQRGEMWVGGDFVAQGYHNRPEATRDAFVNGWYRTGDIGVRRKDGKVFIVDRKKDIIKVKGQQVAPAELEALLHSHERIADAAVIGIWNQDQETEFPQAFVVPKQSPNGTITAQEIMDFVAENLARHKQLRGGIVFVNQIPKSASGKILRKEIKDNASQMPASKL